MTDRIADPETDETRAHPPPIGEALAREGLLSMLTAGLETERQRRAWPEAAILLLAGWIGFVGVSGAHLGGEWGPPVFGVVPRVLLFAGAAAALLVAAGVAVRGGRRATAGFAAMVLAYLLGNLLSGAAHRVLDVQNLAPGAPVWLRFIASRLLYAASVALPMSVVYRSGYGGGWLDRIASRSDRTTPRGNRIALRGEGMAPRGNRTAPRSVEARPRAFPPGVSASAASRDFHLAFGSWRPHTRLGKGDRPRSWAVLMAGFAFVCAVPFFLLMQWQVDFGPLLGGRLPALLLPIAAMALANAFAEELLFRGFLQGAAIGVLGPARGIWAVGILFGLHHWGASFEPLASLPGALLVGAGSVLFAKSVLETRGLGWAVCAHAMVNIGTFSAFYVAG